ncbi:MAG TPA: hypothetical protein VEQ61_08665 [Thermoleophilaceae bacterium]|nr:hypothetical protein [Thermoleophilaceae bacterium]
MGSQRNTLSLGPLIGLVGALLLLVSLFLDWWEELTAWTVFEFLDLLLAVIALAAIAALLDALGVRVMRGVRGSRLALPLALAALVIVVSQLLNDPPAVVGGGNDHDVGIWLALAGSAVMVLGALLSVARISVAFDTGGRDESRDARPRDDEAPTRAAVRSEPPGREPRP